MRPCEEEKQIIRGTYSNLSSILYAPFHYITKGFIKASSKCLTSYAFGYFFFTNILEVLKLCIKVRSPGMYWVT